MESSDEAVIDLFGNVHNQNAIKTVILTVYMTDDQGNRVESTKRECIVTVPAKR